MQCLTFEGQVASTGRCHCIAIEGKLYVSLSHSPLIDSPLAMPRPQCLDGARVLVPSPLFIRANPQLP